MEYKVRHVNSYNEDLETVLNKEERGGWTVFNVIFKGYIAEAGTHSNYTHYVIILMRDKTNENDLG